MSLKFKITVEVNEGQPPVYAAALAEIIYHYMSCTMGGAALHAGPKLGGNYVDRMNSLASVNPLIEVHAPQNGENNDNVPTKQNRKNHGEGATG